jgi:hypothetical protein
MEKERLTIGMGRIAVEYEFLITSDQDIVTEVAFPVPGFDYGFLLTPGAHGDLSGWRVWVEGKELPFETEIRALAADARSPQGLGADQAGLLRRLSIDIETFGHFQWQSDGSATSEMSKLQKAQQDELTRAGLLDGSGLNPSFRPTWTVFKTYHWRQRFPAHKILHVKHEYQPALGLRHFTADSFQGSDADLSSVCTEPGLRKILLAAAPNNNGFGGGGFIDGASADYILTTANTWKTPIKDFELVIETPPPSGQRQYYASLCWDGKLDRHIPGRLTAKAKNFVPKTELRVMFFRVGE